MHTLFHRLRPRHCALLLVGFAFASGCVGGNNADNGKNIGVQAPADGGTRVIVLDSGARLEASATREGGLDTRCGADLCHGSTPDNALACADVGEESGTSSKAPDAGRAPEDSGAATADAGVLDAGTDASDGGPRRSDVLDAGKKRLLPIPAPIPAPPDAAVRYACQVTRDNSGGPVHQCGLAGTGAALAPCTAASDCAPGLACTGTSSPGLCLPYCCEGSCKEPGTFCTERPLLDKKPGKALLVPVCAPGEDCTLLEPYPCSGSGCSCPDSKTACTIVRTDGTRGCVTPGTGKVNDKCPCAAGYYCSLATSLCVKMCKTDGIDERCMPGKCQAAAGFPPGFGLCVGYAPSKE